MKYAIAFFLSPDYTYILNDQEIQQTEQCWIGNSVSIPEGTQDVQYELT